MRCAPPPPPSREKKKDGRKKKNRLRRERGEGEEEETWRREGKIETCFGSTVGKGCYHHAGGAKSTSGGGRRHNGSHNGHHVAGGTSVEQNGHHPPREPRKEENTLVRRSFRRCGDEWRADSRRCVSSRPTTSPGLVVPLSLLLLTFSPTFLARVYRGGGGCRRGYYGDRFDTRHYSGLVRIPLPDIRSSEILQVQALDL